MVGNNVSINVPATNEDPVSESDSEYVIYTVQYGDKIWDIVKKFDSVSTTEVLVLNSITDPGRIQVGQKLKIKKKS
jgi:LysM repeat protein